MFILNFKSQYYSYFCLLSTQNRLYLYTWTWRSPLTPALMYLKFREIHCRRIKYAYDNVQKVIFLEKFDLMNFHRVGPLLLRIQSRWFYLTWRILRNIGSRKLAEACILGILDNKLEIGLCTYSVRFTRICQNIWCQLRAKVTNLFRFIFDVW